MSLLKKLFKKICDISHTVLKNILQLSAAVSVYQKNNYFWCIIHLPPPLKWIVLHRTLDLKHEMLHTSLVSKHRYLWSLLTVTSGRSSCVHFCLKCQVWHCVLPPNEFRCLIKPISADNFNRNGWKQKLKNSLKYWCTVGGGGDKTAKPKWVKQGSIAVSPDTC